MAKETRFEVIAKEGSGIASPSRTILLDTATGVQYLFVQDGYSGGLCPILDKDGKPLAWQV